MTEDSWAGPRLPPRGAKCGVRRSGGPLRGVTARFAQNRTYLSTHPSQSQAAWASRLDLAPVFRFAAFGFRKPDYSLPSSGDDDPVGMRRCPCAGVGQALGQGVELEAAVEAPGEAGEVALGVLWADVMVGPGERGLDVAQRGVHPLKRCPLGGLRPRAGACNLRVYLPMYQHR